MSKILILKFPYSSTFGGGEKHTLTIVEKLRSQHQFFLLSSCQVLLPEFAKRHWPAQSAWAGTEPVTGKSLLLFCITWPFILLNLLRHLIHYKITYHIDTIWCLSLTEKILLTPWARLLGVKVIWMEHLQIERWLLASPLRFWYVWWSRLTTVLTVVEAVRDQLIALGVPRNHTIVIYNAVDTTTFTPDTQPHNVQTQFRILFAGRLAVEKGLDDLLNAFAQVQKTIPYSTLTIVGQGNEASHLTQLAIDLGVSEQVQFTGFQVDVQPWFAQAEVVVLPSTRRETFGLVIAEALACAIPVITTTTGGTKEVVGDCGWIVVPHQPTALAEALLEIYNDYAGALAKAQRGRDRVLSLFNETKMIAAYDTLFSQN